MAHASCLYLRLSMHQPSAFTAVAPKELTDALAELVLELEPSLRHPLPADDLDFWRQTLGLVGHGLYDRACSSIMRLTFWTIARGGHCTCIHHLHEVHDRLVQS